MPRTEFTRKTRREALQRSEQRCEASGSRYGLEDDVRCSAPLSQGVIFDHDTEDGIGGDNSLENCRAICATCDKFKTRGSQRVVAKMKRQRDKADGTWKSKSRPMPGTKASGLKKRFDGKVTRR